MALLVAVRLVHPATETPADVCVIVLARAVTVSLPVALIRPSSIASASIIEISVPLAETLPTRLLLVFVSSVIA